MKRSAMVAAPQCPHDAALVGPRARPGDVTVLAGTARDEMARVHVYLLPAMARRFCLPSIESVVPGRAFGLMKSDESASPPTCFNRSTSTFAELMITCETSAIVLARSSSMG